MKAEFAAGFSCCVSQLCGCDAYALTSKDIWRVNEIQPLNGDTTQCLENGTLFGTPPVP